MGRPRRIEVEVVRRAQKAVAHATSIQELRAAQAVLVPAVMGATLMTTAAVLGVGRATVARLQARFRQSAKRTAASAPRRNWGGRRNALLTVEEETEFLEPWLEQARAGGMLVVSPLRAALAQRLGQPVKASVVYRLLARHGWRKVAPDTRHPKSDPRAQEDWKKNSRKRWQAC
jgi:transposase